MASADCVWGVLKAMSGARVSSYAFLFLVAFRKPDAQDHRTSRYPITTAGPAINTIATIYAEEGARGFLKGVKPTLMREGTYSSVRMGLYMPIKSVRMQSQLPTEPPPHGGSVIRAFAEISGWRAGGFNPLNLWQGVTPTVIRAAFLTSAQLGTYDVVKNDVLLVIFGQGRSWFAFGKDDRKTHFVASLITSVVATTASNPADVIKTQVMNVKKSFPSGKGKVDQTSMGSIVRNLYRAEGLLAFQRGWLASYSRLGPHTIISFVLIEKIRLLMGLKTV
eukprot:g14545.t1